MKKLALILVMFAAFVLVGCFNENPEDVYYTVIFNSDGGSNVTSQTILNGSTAAKPTDPAKDGYTFIAWYNGETEWDFNTPVTNHLTLTAKWEEIIHEYTVDFNSDGGSDISDSVVNEGEKVTKPTDPTKEGFTFAGWYSGETEWDFNTPITADILLTAKWTIVSYTITFDSDGGSSVASQTVDYNQLSSKPADPTKEGFTFIGWYNGTVEYFFGVEVSEDLALTAKWEPITYDASFDSDGGTIIGSQIIEYNGKITEPEEPTKTGYTFKGWFIEEDQWDFNTVVTANTLLTAKWEINRYTIVFNSDGGTLINNQIVDHNDTVVRPAEPIKTGYDFKGWYYGTDLYDFNLLVTQDLTLRAVWELIPGTDPVPNIYTVTFNSNGGDLVTNQNVNEGEKAVEPTEPTKEGYTFLGWYLGTTIYDFDEVVTESLELVAVWEEITYEVTFNSDGGSDVASQTIDYNGKAVKPTNPTKEGYTFLGWFVGENEYDFNTVVTSDLELTAKWQKNSSGSTGWLPGV